MNSNGTGEKNNTVLCLKSAKKKCQWVLRFSFALTLKEVSTYFAISVHLLFKDRNSQNSMGLLATVQLLFTKLCVILRGCTVHLSKMEREEKKGQEWGMRREGEVEERGRPKSADATTVVVALCDINSPEPHCANFIGNVRDALLCHHHTLASKWNERGVKNLPETVEISGRVNAARYCNNLKPF